jgi:hypothetical protein
MRGLTKKLPPKPMGVAPELALGAAVAAIWLTICCWRSTKPAAIARLRRCTSR